MPRVFLTVACASLVLAASRTVMTADPQPIASVWYRGRPAGAPRADDLAAVHAAGFSAISWPAAAGGTDKLRALAKSAGLDVFTRSPTPPITLATALAPREVVDIRVGQGVSAAIAPLAWRAIAHGAREVSFDAGGREGAGLVDATGHRSAWVPAAAAIARQLRTNGALFAQSRPGPAIVLGSPAPAALDVTLLEARKSWVVVATNGGGTRVHVVARLPASVPYALWLNLLDASTMAMLQQTRGPQWVANLEAYAVRVYVIDKTLR